jgi:hypothetical protein
MSEDLANGEKAIPTTDAQAQTTGTERRRERRGERVERRYERRGGQPANKQPTQASPPKASLVHKNNVNPLVDGHHYGRADDQRRGTVNGEAESDEEPCSGSDYGPF